MAWLPVRTLENVTRPTLSVVNSLDPSSVTTAPCTRLPELSTTSTLRGITVTESSTDGLGVSSPSVGLGVSASFLGVFVVGLLSEGF